MNEDDSLDSAGDLTEIAADWAVRNERGLTAAEQDAFLQWLAELPQHGEEYAYYRNGLKDFNLLAEWCPEHSMRPNPDLLEVKPSRSRWVPVWSSLAGIAAIAALVFFFGLAERSGGSDGLRPLRIASAEYLHRELSDGSEIDLRANSDISVQYSEEVRLVELLSGEAHFTVAKNPKRPFVVKVGSTEVHAVGTAFNVRIGSDELGVLVTEGEIRIEREEGDAIQSSADAGTRSARPGEGEKGVVSEFLVSGQYSKIPYVSDGQKGATIEVLGSEEIEEMLAWKHVLLDFDETPLAEVIAEFNKRNETQLRIDGGSLGKLPIIASFRSDEIENFVDLLDRYLNIEISREDDGSIVLRDR